MYCISFLNTLLACPPAITPLIGEDVPVQSSTTAVKSPKSVALPALAMVIYCITLIGPAPPAIIPLVEELKFALFFLLAHKSPKSVASPALAMVIYSIVSPPVVR